MHAIRPGTPLLFFDLTDIEELHNVHRTETGLATLPVDRFTAPLALPEQPCRLLANVSAAEPRRSWCSIDLLDEAGRPLDRYASAPLVTDGVDIPLTWPEGEPARLAGRSIRLRIRLYGARTPAQPDLAADLSRCAAGRHGPKSAYTALDTYVATQTGFRRE